MTSPFAWSFWHSISCHARRYLAVLALSISNARPVRHSTALPFLSLSCLFLVCLLGPNRSAPSARTPSDCHRRIEPHRLGPFALIFFGSPSLGRSPPLGPLLLGSHLLGPIESASSYRDPWIGPLGSNPSSSRCLRSPAGLYGWLFGRSGALPLGVAALSCALPLVLEARRCSTTASSTHGYSCAQPLGSAALSCVLPLMLGRLALCTSQRLAAGARRSPAIGVARRSSARLTSDRTIL